MFLTFKIGVDVPKDLDSQIQVIIQEQGKETNLGYLSLFSSPTLAIR